MKLIADVREAVKAIDDFNARMNDFALCLAESIHDPVGMNISNLITDRVLARGWEPAGVEWRAGARVYRYKPMP